MRSNNFVLCLSSGVLVLVSIILFAGTDHSVTVTNSLVLNFSASNLHASFWLAVTGCVVVVVATVSITMAIITVHRIEKNKLEDAKSILSYNSANTSSREHLKEENDDEIPMEYKYTDPAISEKYPYVESPYYTSSENSLSTGELYDSDDSDMDSAFAKLKTKLSLKSSEVNGGEIEVPEIRCKSGQPTTGIRLNGNLKLKSVSAGIMSSRSASELTPVEHPDIFSEIVSEKSSSSSEKKLTVNVDPVQHPLYFDNGRHLEASTAPLATHFTFTTPRPNAYASDELVLTRSKTHMPLTQRMMQSIGIKHRDPLPLLNQDRPEVPIREPAEIIPEMEQTESIPEIDSAVRTKTFPKKPHTSKSKHRRPSNKELQRNKELNDVYSTIQTIQTFYPGQKPEKPAPWSKARAKLGLRRKTPKTLKSSLMAHGVYSIPTIPSISRSLKKKQTASHPDEDNEAPQSILLVGDIESVGDSSFA